MSVDVRRCGTCGSILEEDWQVCPKCGIPIGSGRIIQIVNQYSVPPVIKSKGTAYFLQFVLPGAGNFYLGDGKNGARFLLLWFVIVVPFNFLFLWPILDEDNVPLDGVIFSMAPTMCIFLFSILSITLSYERYIRSR
tara:strand:+ start:54 stop:464 length:411 start_codon:yes stop_codon:yes gene_type:complete